LVPVWEIPEPNLGFRFRFDQKWSKPDQTELWEHYVSYLPVCKNAAPVSSTNVSIGPHRPDSLVGKEIYIISGQFKGWFGFVRSTGILCVVALGSLGNIYEIQQKHLVLV
jgi:hypothetical protein